jgi:hypothetical protein
LLPAAGLALTHQPLWTVACCGLLGEAFACWISIVRLKRRDGVPLAASLLPAGLVLASVLGAGAFVALGFYRLAPIAGLSWTALGVVLATVVMSALIPELRTEMSGVYARIGRAAARSRLTVFQAR